MAATGFTPIQLYRTATASAVPAAAKLADGELAINTNDGKLFFKNSSGAVTQIASTGGSTGTVSSVGGTGTVNGISLSGTVTTSGNLTLGGTLSGVNLTSQVTGVLPVANGGTGSSSGVYLPLSGGAMTGAITTNSTFDGRDVAADGVTADAALPRAGGALSGNVTNTSTGSLQVSQGSTAQRDSGTAVGRLRYNSTTAGFEGYTAAGWGEIGGGGSSLGTDSIIRTNAKVIAENITFAGNENGSTVGPVTVNNNYTVTVTNGSTWVIL